MRTEKGTLNHNESDDIEVAYFDPSIHDDGVISQSIAIAPLENNLISFIFSKLYENRHHSFIRFVFTETEINMLISALQEAKNRRKEGRVIK